MARLRFIYQNREVSVVIIIAFLFLGMGLINESYTSLRTVSQIFNSSLILILVAIGSAFVIITKGIDVSVGSILGLSAITLGILLNSGTPLPAAILLTLIVGVLAGAFNGLLITLLGIPPIVATLGTLGLYRGTALIITSGSWIETLPASIKRLASVYYFGITLYGWITLAVLVSTYLFLKHTSWGRYFYATGSNVDGARLIGIPTRLVSFSAYTINGFLAATAGIVFTSQIGFIPTQAGTGLELRAIGACVIGGVSLLGGAGSGLGAMLGAFFLTAIDSALVFLRFPAYWNDIIVGSILLAVLILDAQVRGAMEHLFRVNRYRRFALDEAESYSKRKSPDRLKSTAVKDQDGANL